MIVFLLNLKSLYFPYNSKKIVLSYTSSRDICITYLRNSAYGAFYDFKPFLNERISRGTCARTSVGKKIRSNWKYRGIKITNEMKLLWRQYFFFRILKTHLTNRKTQFLACANIVFFFCQKYKFWKRFEQCDISLLVSAKYKKLITQNKMP